MTARVLLAGCWDTGAGYPRTESLAAGLAARGSAPAACRVDAGLGRTAKQRVAARPWTWPAHWLALRSVRRRLLAAFDVALAEMRPDVVLVPYPGHLAVRWLRARYSGTLVLDLFLPAYGTAVEDRRLHAPGSLPARLLQRLDVAACRAADLVLLDTPCHADLVARRTGLARERFDWVPVGVTAPPAVTPVPARHGHDRLRVLFFGTGVPLHGLDVWLSAVERAPEVELEVIGGSPAERARAMRLGPRVRVRDAFVPADRLARAIDAAHVVAGIMGTSEKARAVVPFKVVHALAHGRPVVTADTPAVRALLAPGEDCVVARPGCPEHLAQRLRELAWAPHETLATLGERARARYHSTFSHEAVGARLLAMPAFGGVPAAAHDPIGGRCAVAS